MSGLGIVVLGSRATAGVALGDIVAVVGRGDDATVGWPAGSGVAYAVNAGVEALEVAGVETVVVLAADLANTAGLVDRLRVTLGDAAAALPASGADVPFSAAAFTVAAWRRLGGVDEGYLDVFADTDFAAALRAAGERVEELSGLPPSPAAEVPLRRRVRNELMYRSRWGSPVALWLWVARRVLVAVPSAEERRAVLGGVIDGLSWRHTRAMMERAR